MRGEASWGEPEQVIWRCLHTAQHIHRKRIDLKTALKVNTNRNGYSSPFLKKRTRTDRSFHLPIFRTDVNDQVQMLTTRFEKAITISYLICQILYSLTFVFCSIQNYLKFNCFFIDLCALYIISQAISAIFRTILQQRQVTCNHKCPGSPK